MGEIIYLYILFSITVKIILNIREIIFLKKKPLLASLASNVTQRF